MKPLIILFLILAAPLAYPSEADFLNWSSMKVDLQPSKEAGNASIEVAAEKGVWKKFVFKAFGKEHVLTREDLKKLQGFPLSSLATTHEAGYEILGGYTLSASFHKIYYNDSKNLIRDDIYISVSKKGVTIGDLRSRNLTKENNTQ